VLFAPYRLSIEAAVVVFVAERQDAILIDDAFFKLVVRIILDERFFKHDAR